MRLLLIAYEYPPSPSPQSLRWIYLTRELARLGHEVHVIAPDLGGETPGLPAIPLGVVVHRTFPGPVRGLMSFLRKRQQRRREAGVRAAPDDAAADAPVAIRPPRNWKQRISELIQALAEHLHFPDIRGEWRYWAARRLPSLLREIDPDVVLSSHEPATSLELGLTAKRLGYAWVADLGDPVLAAYTPPRWRRRAERIERDVCRRADIMLLTNMTAAGLLADRHGPVTRMEIVPQGFDCTLQATGNNVMFEPERLELLYTGSFYHFRRPDALVSALRGQPSVRLNIASITVPEGLLAAARAHPDQIRLLGFLPHLDILSLQRQADVLVNIANDDASQIPGKFNEYLGAGRPILHLSKGEDQVVAAICALRRGWVSSDELAQLSDTLAMLVAMKRAGTLTQGLDLSIEPVREVSWRQLALRLHGYLQDIAPETP